MDDGIIKLDSEAGAELGFTSDKFDGWLWKTANEITISMIVSKQEGEGNLSALFKAIEDRGMSVAVPTPFARMQSILERKGYRAESFFDAEMGPGEIWRKPVTTPSPTSKAAVE